MPTDRFQFLCPLSAYEDLSKADRGEQMRIAGIASTEAKDLQGEEILQDGLNWDDCLGVRGFFNNDHRKSFLDILGAPERVQMFKAGEKLPDGSTPDHACTWVEGHLFDTADGRKTWELAKALPASGRRLGMSVEGKVEHRTGPDGLTIAKARIQHIAITHQPVNQQCTIDALLRSISAVRKTIAVGEGAEADSGKKLLREQLDEKLVNLAEDDEKKPKKRPDELLKRKKKASSAQKSRSSATILKSIYELMPDATADYAVALCRALRRESSRSHDV